MPTLSPEHTAAYDRALAESVIDNTSIVMTGNMTFTVTISGRVIPARMKGFRSVRAMQSALTDALGLYCATRSVEILSGASANWSALRA